MQAGSVKKFVEGRIPENKPPEQSPWSFIYSTDAWRSSLARRRTAMVTAPSQSTTRERTRFKRSPRLSRSFTTGGERQRPALSVARVPGAAGRSLAALFQNNNSATNASASSDAARDHASMGSIRHNHNADMRIRNRNADMRIRSRKADSRSRSRRDNAGRRRY
jgi:hypothetical protein